jgi:hypothetical protein
MARRDERSDLFKRNGSSSGRRSYGRLNPEAVARGDPISPGRVAPVTLGTQVPIRSGQLATPFSFSMTDGTVPGEPQIGSSIVFTRGKAQPIAATVPENA